MEELKEVKYIVQCGSVGSIEEVEEEARPKECVKYKVEDKPRVCVKIDCVLAEGAKSVPQNWNKSPNHN